MSKVDVFLLHMAFYSLPVVFWRLREADFRESLLRGRSGRVKGRGGSEEVPCKG